MTTTGDAEGTRYDLVIRTDQRRFVLRFPYAGITLYADRLRYEAETAVEKPYSDIFSIRLSQGYVARSGPVASCFIQFRNGQQLTVASSGSNGLSDSGRNELYGTFVRDFHSRLGEAERRNIAFIGGNSAGFQMFGKITLVVAALFFVVLPIGLFLYTREWKTLGLLVAGSFLVAPLWSVIRKNEPRTYDPRSVDPDLLP